MKMLVLCQSPSLITVAGKSSVFAAFLQCALNKVMSCAGSQVF